MAMTEARPEADIAHPASAPAGSVVPVAQSPITAFFGTGRDQVIGRLWIGTALVFLVTTGVVGGLLGAERIKPETYNVLSKDSFAQALSLHGVSAVFLVTLPLIIGVATIVVPRQVGSATIAFPRAAALAYWGYLGAGVLV